MKFEISFLCHRVDQKNNKNIVRISALKFFVASWGFPGSFFGLPGDLVSNDIYKETYKKSQKAFRAEIIILVVFLVETMTLKRHFEIN